MQKRDETCIKDHQEMTLCRYAEKCVEVFGLDESAME